MSESTIAIPFARLDAEKTKRLVFSVLFFCAFLALCIRGVFEVTIGKALAYIVQLGLWTGVQFIAVAAFRFRTTDLLTIGILLTLLFGVTAVISSFWTLGVSGFSIGNYLDNC